MMLNYKFQILSRKAERLGFDKKVISQMSAVIYSDPKITTDREKLKQKVKKYIS
jgi:hypothetical protein